MRSTVEVPLTGQQMEYCRRLANKAGCSPALIIRGLVERARRLDRLPGTGVTRRYRPGSIHHRLMSIYRLRLRVGKTDFTLQELQREAQGTGGDLLLPDSVSRILRILRQDGQLDYKRVPHVRDARERPIYRFLPVAGDRQ